MSNPTAACSGQRPRRNPPHPGRRAARLLPLYSIAMALALIADTPAYAQPELERADDRRERRVDDTAYTLPAGEFSVGFWDLQVGLLDELTIGTYIAPWFLFPVLEAPIPTGFAKVRDPWHGPVSFSLRATFIYLPATALAAGLADDGAEVSADAVMLPFEAAASIRLGKRFTQSAALTYVLTQAGGSQSSSTSVAGALSASQLTLSSLTEYRLTKAFSFTLLARVLLVRSSLRARVAASEGSTRIDADVGLSTDYGRIVACIVPGIALHGSNVNFELGFGYGSWWLPIVQLPLPFVGPVPEVNFYVRF